MKIEYGIPTDKEAIQLRLGIERGLFRELGLDLSLRVVFGGPEVAALYSAGELKVGELGSPPATTALSKGANFKIVGSSVRRRALQYFVVAPSIRDWEDLRGKTVAALSVGSCSYWFARMVLERHGLDPDSDVSLIGLGRRYPDVVELFKSVIKMTIVVLIIYQALRDEFILVLLSQQFDLWHVMVFTGRIVMKVITRVALVYLIIAFFDYFWI